METAENDLMDGVVGGVEREGQGERVKTDHQEIEWPVNYCLQ